jgi:hypothetical protein
MPSLIHNSSAIRRQPHEGFSPAILRMSARRSGGTRGRPVGRDFQHQTQRTRSRCQRTSVAGRRITNASRQSNRRDRRTSQNRSKGRARRGRMPRSMTMASWRRRNRTSARSAMYARAVRVPEQRVQDDKKDLEQRNGQRMIAATSQRRAGLSRTAQHCSAHWRAQRRGRATPVGERTGQTWQHARGEVRPCPGSGRRSDPASSLIEERTISG